MNSPFPSFLKTALLTTALLSAGHLYAADADGIVVYNAQHESLTKSWIEGFTKETGIKVTVPPFIAIGEVVQIDTRTGEYMSRAK